MQAAVCEYFARLTGTSVGPDTPISLSSAQMGAASAWLRRQGVAIAEKELLAPHFSVARLLGSDLDAGRQAAVQAQVASEAATTGLPSIGIDIEHVSALPDAPDFRDHEFYAANFTDAEIAYCIGRRDPRLSLCGLWAAKEAVRKASGGVGLQTSLIGIEIEHDEAGRPTHPQFALSISHAGDLCVAVAAAPAPAAQPPREDPGPASASAPEAAGGRIWKFLPLLSLLVALAALGLSLR